MKDMIVIIVSSLHLRKSVNVGELYCPFSLAIFKLEVCCCNVTLCFVLRDTEYYDYGHGEAQDSSYEPYGKIMNIIVKRSHWTHCSGMIL